MNFNFRERFEGFIFFRSYLGNRIAVALALSLFVGVLDGLGLSMFLPLLQIVSGTGTIDASQLGGLQFVINAFQSANVGLTLFSVLLIMVAFFLLKGIIVFIQFYYKVSLQETLIRKIRIASIQGLNAMKYKAFIQTDAGKIQNTLGGEVERVSRAYQSYFQIVQCGIMVAVYMVFAFFVNAQFAVLVSVGGFLSNLIYRKIYVSTKGASRRLTKDAHEFHGFILQYVHHFKYLKATGALRTYGQKLEQSANKIESTNRYIGLLMAVLNATREPLIIAVVAVIIYVQTGILGSSLGPILVSLLFFYRALSYLMQLQTHLNFYLSVSGSLSQLKAFESELKQQREHTGTKVFQRLHEKLIVKDGQFSFGNKRVLSDIELEINKFETIAFVGESGSGKTTFVNILAGLLPLESGSYQVDGVDAQQLDINSFQKRIGYITQDPVIFNDTIFNNVTFWAHKSPAVIDKFKMAMKKAAAYDFVEALEEKEDTILGHNGMNLSGGQKQRISIARELYKEVDILILDEATSALDSETETEIKENIENLKGSYTLLIVAHRLSTIRYADRIVLLQNGEISRVDTFNGLMDRSDAFKRMVRMQDLN